MTYNTIATMAQDNALRLRITACAAEQGVKTPEWWAHQYVWNVVASPGWAASYKYALDSNIVNPGHDEAVITDATILSTVQAMISAAEASVIE